MHLIFAKHYFVKRPLYQFLKVTKQTVKENSKLDYISRGAENLCSIAKINLQMTF